MAIGREGTFLSLTDAANILVWNSVMDITKKKSTYNLMCSLDTHFPVNWLFKQKSFNNNENKVLHSFLKSSSIPYCVVRFWVWGKNSQLWTWHNFCCRHYTVKLFLHQLEWGNVFVYLMWTFDDWPMSELMNVILVRLNCKLIFFSGCADNRNIYTTACVYMWLWSVEYPIWSILLTIQFYWASSN